jgi:hypothetical protein
VEWHTKNVFRGKFHWHCGAPRIGLAGRLAAEYPAASARCLGLAYPDARGLGGGWGACRTSVVDGVPAASVGLAPRRLHCTLVAVELSGCGTTGGACSHQL